ncbi:MAG: hypothetical protein ACK4SY_06885 [Pyrobaculum sp.]
MTSLEVLVLTAIALLVVFAALPYVVNMLYASMAPLEYRNALNYILLLADSMEADFGMSGSRKYFALPSFYYGRFGVVNSTYRVKLWCGGDVVLAWRSFSVWYNSTYLVDVGRLYRGMGGGLFAEPGDTLFAVNSTQPGNIRLYPRLFVVRGEGESYIYLINATVRLGGYSYLTYEMRSVDVKKYSGCDRMAVGGVEVPLGGVVYLVVQEAVVSLR